MKHPELQEQPGEEGCDWHGRGQSRLFRQELTGENRTLKGLLKTHGMGSDPFATSKPPGN